MSVYYLPMCFPMLLFVEFLPWDNILKIAIKMMQIGTAMARNSKIDQQFRIKLLSTYKAWWALLLTCYKYPLNQLVEAVNERGLPKNYK